MKVDVDVIFDDYSNEHLDGKWHLMPSDEFETGEQKLVAFLRNQYAKAGRKVRHISIWAAK